MKAENKQTEMASLPNDWEYSLIGDVTSKVGSGITPRGGASNYLSFGRPFVRSQNVGWGKLLLDDIAFISDQIHESFIGTEIQPGDVFLNISGASIGRSSVATSDVIGGNVNQHVCIIRGLDGILNPKFLNSFLISSKGQRQIEAFQSGGNRQGLNFAQIKAIEIPLPKFPEQQAIAEVLSDADAWMESLETQLQKKRLIKQGAMQELLRPSDDWDQITFEEAFHFLRTASYSRADLKEADFVGYVHYGDIHTKWNFLLDLDKTNLPTISEDMLKAYTIVQSGDIIMADASEDYAGVGKSVEVISVGNQKMISGLHTFLLRQKRSLFVSKFMGYLIHAPYIKSQLDALATGLKVYSISKAALKQVDILFPTFTEQTRIAAILSEMDAEIEILEQKLIKARQIKQGMMQQLLTGQIRLVKPPSLAAVETLQRATA